MNAETEDNFSTSDGLAQLHIVVQLFTAAQLLYCVYMWLARLAEDFLALGKEIHVTGNLL